MRLRLPDAQLNLPLLTVALHWGVNQIAIKLGLRELPPLTWSAVRFTLAALALFWLLHRREGGFAVPRRHWARLLVAGALSFGAATFLFTAGLRYTTATNSSLIVASSPVITALLAWLVGVERFQPVKAAGVTLAFAGVAVLLLAGGDGFQLSTTTLRGDLLSLAGTVLIGGYAILILPLFADASPLRVTTWTFGLAALAMWVAVPLEFPRLSFRTLTLLTPATLLYSALLAGAWAQIAWNEAIHRTSPTQVVVYLYLPPIVAAVVSAVVLGERPRLAQALGALVIFAGLYLAQRPEGARRQKATLSTP
ncbi:MAG: DMT family transporter [Methanocella sp.]